MDESNHKDDVAWHQIEAAAAGDLDADGIEHMNEAVRKDPELRIALERARDVHRALKKVREHPVPSGLLGRLWSIPAGARRPAHEPPAFAWPRLAAPAVAAALALVAGLVLLRPTPSPAPDPQLAARQAAVEDFRVAMLYLQRATQTADEATRAELGAGIADAFSASRDALLTENSTIDNGG